MEALSDRERAYRRHIAQTHTRINALTELVRFWASRAKSDPYDLGHSTGLILAHAIITGQYVVDPACQTCNDGSKPKIAYPDEQPRE